MKWPGETRTLPHAIVARDCTVICDDCDSLTFAVMSASHLCLWLARTNRSRLWSRQQCPDALPERLWEPICICILTHAPLSRTLRLLLRRQFAPRTRLEARVSPSVPPGWACPACTFVNAPLHLACAICGNERPGSNGAERAAGQDASSAGVGGAGKVEGSGDNNGRGGEAACAGAEAAAGSVAAGEPGAADRLVATSTVDDCFDQPSRSLRILHRLEGALQQRLAQHAARRPQQRMRVGELHGVYVDTSLQPLLRRLSAPHVVTLVAALLCEQRVVMFSEDAATLTDCWEALMVLLYPFEWLHPYIPLMPLAQLDAFPLDSCPVPFAIGMPLAYTATHGVRMPPEAMVVDLDRVSCRGINWGRQRDARRVRSG